jgi:hypothetical protein
MRTTSMQALVHHVTQGTSELEDVLTTSRTILRTVTKSVYFTLLRYKKIHSIQAGEVEPRAHLTVVQLTKTYINKVCTLFRKDKQKTSTVAISTKITVFQSFMGPLLRQSYKATDNKTQYEHKA